MFNDIVTAIDGALNAVPPLVMLALITLIAWQAAGRRTAILVGLIDTLGRFLLPAALAAFMGPSAAAA